MQHRNDPGFWPGLALALAMAVGSSASAQDGSFGDPYYEYRDEVERGEFDYDDSEDIPWIENETEVLALPRDEDLVAVAVDQMPPGMRLLIDRRRITVNPDDRVIRLWLVVRSDDGVDNGTFEGFRCETREYKVYAYANPRRRPPVRKASRPRWQAVRPTQTNNHRLELLQDYFCGIRGTRDADEIRRAVSGEFKRETFFSH